MFCLRGLRLQALTCAWVLLALLVAGCQQAAPQSHTPGDNRPSVVVPTAPATTSAAAQPPAPQATSTQDTATIIGVALNAKDRSPLTSDPQGVNVYLAKVRRDAGNPVAVAALDRASAPRADPDAQGAFRFTNVPPGEYGVVVVSPFAQVLAHKVSELDKDLIITVAAGQMLDVGPILARYEAS